MPCCGHEERVTELEAEVSKLQEKLGQLEAELGKLKGQTLERTSNCGCSRDIRHDIKVIVSDDEFVISITDRVILHQYFIGLQHGLHFLDFGKLHALQSRPS